MSDIRIDDYTLKKLKVKFDNWDFAIPEIQRQYVWNKPRVCKLMDSIFRGYSYRLMQLYMWKNGVYLQREEHYGEFQLACPDAFI